MTESDKVEDNNKILLRIMHSASSLAIIQQVMNSRATTNTVAKLHFVVDFHFQIFVSFSLSLV
jgi:hypothetical protein